MRSRINPTLFVNDNESVVSIVRRQNRDHALIFFETKNYQPGEGFAIRWFDLMPNPKFDVDYTKHKHVAQCKTVLNSYYDEYCLCFISTSLFERVN